MNLILDLNAFAPRGEIKLGDNGPGAKSAPVRILLNSGDPIEWPGYGRIVWDFATMNVKPRIPLDFAHDCEDSCGYLNNFDTSSGQLICSGAVVIADDETAELVTKMREGVPYQASLESHGGDLEFVAANEPVNVNGRDQVGPLWVVRNWTLAAGAICKFGADSNTASELRLAASKKLTFKMTAQTLTNNMSEVATNAVETEVKPEAVEAGDGIAKVEAIEVVTAEVVKAEASPEAVEVETPTEAVKAVDVVEAPVVVTASVDPREEFKRFVASFGDKAQKYFGEGLTFAAATDAFVVELKAENDSLKKRLSTLDRGAEPVQFKDAKLRNDGEKEPLFRVK